MTTPVAQIVETLGMGGAENLAVQIANALADHGCDSHLIVMTRSGPLADRIAPDVTTHYLGFERASIRNPLKFSHSLVQGLRLLSRLIRAQKIGLVQTHLPGANFWGLFLSYRRICQVIATVHNNREFHYGDVDHRLLLALRKRAYRAIVTRCTGTVAVSEKVRTSLVADLGLPTSASERITVVTNGVSIPDPLDEPRRAQLRTRYGVAPDQLMLIAAGRFSEQKNFTDLLQAVALLKDRHDEFRLVLAGNGEMKAELQNLRLSLQLTDQVIMPGTVGDLGDVMLAADIFVMSSLWEGLPLVLLEAMAAGLPAVAYGIPGVDEVLNDQVTGRRAEVGNPRSLATCLTELMDSPKKRQQMSEASRQVIASRFDFDRLVADLVALYSVSLAAASS